MKNFGLITLNTLIFFILINILIVLIWPVISDQRNKKHAYSEEVSDLLNLSEENLIILQNETWRKDYKFRYEPFIGHTEIDKKGKFVNFSFDEGRKVNRPKTCNKNLYFYGGSTAFGYGVTDNQTIAEYLQKSLPEDHCVFNHGRGFFYSLQENHLFFSHIETKKEINYAIFLDGINEVCGGHFATRNLKQNFSSLSEKPYLLWKKSLRTFIYSLPIYQLSLKFGSKDWLKNDSTKEFLNINGCEFDGYETERSSELTLDSLFKKRIDARVAICDKFNVICHTFLQPMPGTSGKHSNLLILENQLNYLKKKYSILSKIKDNVFDLQYVLKNDQKLSYVDAIHYSPESSKIIAKEIKKVIFQSE